MPADGYGQIAQFPQGDALQEEADNGFADPANIELSEIKQAPKPVLTEEEQLVSLGNTVTRHPLYREILYKVLQYCREERLLQDIEREIATYPEFAHAGQNQYFLVNCLARSYGLDFIERDEDGNVVTEARKEGLTEDEIDDLVATYNYKTTAVGEAFLEEFSPKARLVGLLELAPERTDTYIDVLEFVAGGTRSMAEIDELLKDRDIQTLISGRYETIKPSVFVDKLERAGALVWDSGWKLTKEGEAYLADMKNVG